MSLVSIDPDADGIEVGLACATAGTPSGRPGGAASPVRNRLFLPGLMMAAGPDFYRNDRRHCQRFGARRAPRDGDSVLLHLAMAA